METIKSIKSVLPYYEKKLRKLKRIEKSQVNYILQESDGFVPQEPNSDFSKVQKDIEYNNTILSLVRRELHDFTVSYFVPEFNMTLDELEMYQKDFVGVRWKQLQIVGKKQPDNRQQKKNKKGQT